MRVRGRPSADGADMNDTPTTVIPLPPSSAHWPDLPPDDRPGVLHRLEREWRQLAVRSSIRRRVVSWGLDDTVLSLDQALAATGWRPYESAPCRRPVGSEADAHEGDETVRRLLRLAPTDELAARVVLQRMLPGLRATANRWRRRAVDGWEPIDELVSVAWSVIRTFPVETRPRYLVANLLRDTEYLAYRKQARRLMVSVPSGVPERRGWPTESLAMAGDPAEETLDDDALLELVRMVARVDAMRDAVLDDADRVVLRLLAAGKSLAEAAELMGCTSRTVQNHRVRLVHRLRAALAA